MRVTRKQIELITMWYPELTQAEIARRLGINRQKVHYHLERTGAILPGKKPERDPETGKYMTAGDKADAQFYREINPTMVKFANILRPTNAIPEPVKRKRKAQSDDKPADRGVFSERGEDNQAGE